MRGPTRDRNEAAVIQGHAFIENLRRGHDELGVHARTRHLRIAAAFDELPQGHPTRGLRGLRLALG